MGDQEINYLHKIQEEDSICDSMHHLSTACDPHQAAAAASLDAYAAACGNSGKRQSPLSRSLLQEPFPKRATPNPTSSPSAAAVDRDFFGFKKLSLPQYFNADSPPPLRRTISEPIYSPGTPNCVAAPPQFSEIPTSPAPIRNQQPRQEMSDINVAQETYPLQETARSLYRTVSAPIPVFNPQVASAAATPPRPPARRKPSKSPSCVENPSAKRLKRMKERLREMSEWWNQVASEDDDEENLESENDFTDNDPKEECEDDVGHPSQEAVFVEKSGECLVLHFKCPCGDGYQILLSGNNCYYKLTNFRNC